MMWLWAWFTGGGWILAAGAVVVLGLVAAAVVVAATARKRAYARDRARHAWYEPVVEQAPEQDFYGAATLEDEREWYEVRVPLIPPPDALWKQQTAADLAPETLDAWGPRGPSASYEDWLAEGQEEPIDLGYLSLPAELQRELESPGPGLCPCGKPIDHTEFCYGDGLDDPGPGASVRSLAPGPDLGRLAWLDQQLAAHADWARRMRGQVTGWGLEAAAA